MSDDEPRVATHVTVYRFTDGTYDVMYTDAGAPPVQLLTSGTADEVLRTMSELVTLYLEREQ